MFAYGPARGGGASSCGLAAAACLAFLVGTSGTQDAVANGDTRTLSLYHNHTRESLTVTFRRNGAIRSAGPRAAQLVPARLAARRADAVRSAPLRPRLGGLCARSARTSPCGINSAYRSPEDERHAAAAFARRGEEQPEHARQGDGLLPARRPDRAAFAPSACACRRAASAIIRVGLHAVRASRRRQRARLAAHDPRPARAHLPRTGRRSIPSDGEPMARYEEARAEILARRRLGRRRERRRLRRKRGGPAREGLLGDAVRLYRGGGGRRRGSALCGRPRGLCRASRAAGWHRAEPQFGLRRGWRRQGRRRSRCGSPPARRRVPNRSRSRFPSPPSRPSCKNRSRKLPPFRRPASPARRRRSRAARPRLAWQQGPAAMKSEPAPLPPRRPEEPVATGALAFAPLPPGRPGLAPVRVAAVDPAPPEPALPGAPAVAAAAAGTGARRRRCRPSPVDRREAGRRFGRRRRRPRATPPALRRAGAGPHSPRLEAGRRPKAS